MRDKDCRGLALIVNPTGMTWSYAYRPRGIDALTGRRWPNRTVTIGNPGDALPDDARAEANRIKGQAAAGADPAAEKKARGADEQRKRGATLKRLLDDYEIALPNRPKMRGAGLPSAEYVAEEIAQVRQGARPHGSQRYAGGRSELMLRCASCFAGRRTERATARGPVWSLSRFLDWCQDAGHIQANPCALIARARRPRAPQARSHYLTPTELARLWEAAGGLREPVWRDLARFLIVVPCRRDEAARLEWSHLDLDRGRMAPAGPHDEEPRSAPAAPASAGAGSAARASQGRLAARGWSFRRRFRGARWTRSATSRRNSNEATGLDGWTWHDFRRSFATALGEASIPEAVADAVLNHRQSATRGGVLGVYQRASRWPEQVRAMELWGRLLAAALEMEATPTRTWCRWQPAPAEYGAPLPDH